MTAVLQSAPSPAATRRQVSTAGTGYARRVLPNDGTLWTTGALLKATAAEIRFPETGAFTAPLGRVTHLVAFDADTGARMLVLPRRNGGTYLAEGDSLPWLAGEVSLTMMQDR